MAALNRRRFIAISASAMLVAGRAHSGSLRQWSGSGLGARVTITLDHPDGERLAEKAFAEIDRLEGIFSLYRATSALSRMNSAGILDNPPFELLECLSLCGGVHQATGGLFDPTVQPLWQLYASAHANQRRPDYTEISETLKSVGWDRVSLHPGGVRLAAGTALTLNGVAQGYVADRVAEMFQREGLSDVLVDTGEIAALGREWPVTLDAGGPVGDVRLRNQALASSAPLGTVFDAEGKVGHILHPRTGLPAAPEWKLVSVTAPRAALADALSTAACLMPRNGIIAACAGFPDTSLVLAERA